MAKKKSDHIVELRQVLNDNPKEAMLIAEAAVLGLLIVDGAETVISSAEEAADLNLLITSSTKRIITGTEDYGSAADYIDHVAGWIYMQPAVRKRIKELQEEALKMIAAENESAP